MSRLGGGEKKFRPSLSLCLARSLCVAAHDFDSIGLHSVLVVELEADIFDKEGPDFIAEPIGVQVTLPTQECMSKEGYMLFYNIHSSHIP